jgi:hypothetical protein
MAIGYLRAGLRSVTTDDTCHTSGRQHCECLKKINASWARPSNQHRHYNKSWHA